MNKKRWAAWIGAIGFLIFLFLASRWIPASFVDPWGLLKPRKIIQMIFLLAVIQMMGAAFVQLLGVRAGMVATGFLGGIVSSTALTASLSRRSQNMTIKNISVESLAFLSATLAMLIQAMILVFIGLSEMHPSLLILFAGPIGMTVFLIVRFSRQLDHHHFVIEEGPLLDIVSILKLAVFIAGILALSQLLQNLFGRSGLEALTFLVSLFEIHGSVIANVQLHDANIIDLRLLGELLTLSLMASYTSKVFLVATLGNSFLKKRMLLWIGLVLLSLGASWLVFQYYA